MTIAVDWDGKNQPKQKKTKQCSKLKKKCGRKYVSICVPFLDFSSERFLCKLLPPST